MVELSTLIIKFINLNLMMGFGYYSLLYFTAHYFITRKHPIYELDDRICQSIVWIGMFSFLLFASNTLHNFYTSNGEEHASFVNRLTGPYWFQYWIQAIICLIGTQLLRIKTLRKSIVYRVVFSLLILLCFERYLIMITSFHIDYLPAHYSLLKSISTLQMFLLISKKIAMLSFIGTIYMLITKQMHKKRGQNCS